MSWPERLHHSRLSGFAVALVCFGVGCTGALSEGDGRAPPGPGSVVSVPGGPRIWRLTRDEYDRTVADLLGDTTRPARALSREPAQHGYDSHEPSLGIWTQSELVELDNVARGVAERAVRDRLASLLPCDAADVASDACGRAFVERFGRRAFRRPLSEEEIAAYFGLYSSTRTALDGPTAIQIVIEAFLLSPSFLFRTELGAGDATRSGAHPLTAHELATALSYFLWDTMPDAALDAAADSGALADPAEVERQARRMIADERARPALASFWLQLLGYDRLEAGKDETRFPDYEALAPSMREETSRFVAHVAFDDAAGDLATLFTSSTSFIDAPLAELYGVDAPATAFAAVALDPAERSGVLTHAGLMSAWATPTDSSPVRRGYFVTTRLLCQELPDPPEGVAIADPPGDGTQTTRERFERHSTDASCSGCHALLDPRGFPFEHFDAIGRYRIEENGQPIDPQGELTGTDVDGPVDDARALATSLAASAGVRSCLVRQTFRWASGRQETEADQPTLDAMSAHFEASDTRIRELLVGYVLAESFGQRRSP